MDYPCMKHVRPSFHSGILVWACTVILSGMFGAKQVNADEMENRLSCGTHTVEPGETLAEIALARTGNRSNTNMIFRMNAQLRSPDMISPGMVLMLPCGMQPETEKTGPDGISNERSVKRELTTEPSAHNDPGYHMGIWKASAGDFLVSVMTRWGEQAGYDVVVEQDGNWRFGVNYSRSGLFREAVDEVIAGFVTAASAPVIVFYTNDVMVIGVR